ncbi:MAG: ABC transporter substrate-binding protein [Planctomycetota bacterium]
MGSLVIAVLAISLIIYAFSSRSEPIKIGFLGVLTGRGADLGISGRNGALLAIEAKNQQGGIHGRQITLIVEDDKLSQEVGVQAAAKLIEQDVEAIIGPMASSVAVAVVDVMNAHRVLAIGPTISTNELTGKDDYFYRVFPYSAQTTKLLAEHVYHRMGIRSVAVVLDVTNRAHTESNLISFQEVFESLGGKIVDTLSFVSGQDIVFTEMAREATKTQPECLYLLTNAMDTAFLCQQLSKMEKQIPIISSDWSLTDDIIQFGGQSVEGILAFHTIDHHSQSERFLQFQKDYRARFGDDPSFSAIHAYDASRILIAALEKNSDRNAIRQTIQEIGTFEGLQTKISFDSNGDVQRKHFLMVIENGEFVTPR